MFLSNGEERGDKGDEERRRGEEGRKGVAGGDDASGLPRQGF
jgi:hypothetical protein